MTYRSCLPAVVLALLWPGFGRAQTNEIVEEIEAQLQALRTATPLVFPGPAASVANEEAAINGLAAKIDLQLEAFWASNKIKPSEMASDAEFLRRAMLDLTGKIPNVHEVREFTSSVDPHKRDKKIAELLNKSGFANHYASVLRQQWLPQSLDNPQFQFVGTQFETWLRDRLRENVRMDRIVRDVLTAPTLFNRGGMNVAEFDAANSAFGFNQVNEFKPENVAASASRLFMGVKMECAQCHDHPFARISREQFWETAAFFAEIQPVVANLNDAKLKRQIRIQDPNPKKVKTVQARFFDDTAQPEWKDAVSPREVFVNWLISPKNKFFARNAVERAWAHFFGLGFIDPIDEPGPDNAEVVPGLVDGLAKAYAESGYDTRFLIKVITRTKAYQLSSRQTDPSQSNPRHFARMNVKAMTAEQLFDSLVSATGMSTSDQNMRRQRFGGGGTRGEFLTKFASTEKITERQMSILQALTLMNGKLINDQTSVERSSFLAAINDAPFMNVDSKVESLFLATFSRPPTPVEAERFGSYVQRGGVVNDNKKALDDQKSALSSSEFCLNH